MNYQLRVGEEDEVIDESSDGQFFFLVGHENIVPGLESELLDLVKGDKRVISVSPEQGYGVRDESKVIALPRTALPKDFVVEIGLPLELEDQQGNAFPVWIAGTHDSDVVLDGNHPLADETLHFTIEVMDVRAASEEELTHGHVHGPGGHHH